MYLPLFLYHSYLVCIPLNWYPTPISSSIFNFTFIYDCNKSIAYIDIVTGDVYLMELETCTHMYMLFSSHNLLYLLI